MKGFSFLIAFGAFARPRIEFFPRSVRIVFGPLALYFSFLDLDALFVKMTQVIKEQK